MRRSRRRVGRRHRAGRRRRAEEQRVEAAAWSASAQLSASRRGHGLAARRAGCGVAVLMARICGWVWWLRWKVQATGSTRIWAGTWWSLSGPGWQGGPGGRWSAVGPLLSSDRWCLQAAVEAFGPGRCRAQDECCFGLVVVLTAAAKLVGVLRGHREKFCTVCR
jgi:hypothetical protein